MRYFLAISDQSGANIGGGSTSPTYSGWFSVADFGFGGVNESSGIGGSNGAVDFPALQITLRETFQTGSPQFLALMAGAAGPTSVRLIGVDETRVGSPKTFEMQLSSAALTGFATSSGGMALSIDAPRISLSTWTPDAANKLFADTFTHIEDATPATPLAGGGAQPAVAATTYYMAVTGLNGGAGAAGYAGWFVLDDFDVGALRSFDPLTGGGSALGIAGFSALDATFRGDTGLTAFLALAASGGGISSIRIEGLRNGVATTRVDLGNVTVTALQDRADGGFGVSLGFEKIGMATIAPGGVTSSTLYNVWDNMLAGPPIPVATPGPSGGTTLAPTQFFATMSGIKGDVTDAGRVGWFRVEAPLLQMDRDYDPAAMNAGLSPGDARFSQIDLYFRSETACTALFGVASAGSVLAGVTVQGTSAAGVVYNLDLAQARITSFLDMGDGMQVSLSFDAFDLMTRQSLGGGAVNTVSGWNLVTEQAVINVPSVNNGFAAADSTVAPTKYYLVMDGVNGGSRAAGYAGWFELDGLNIEAGPQGHAVTLSTVQQMGYGALLKALVNADTFAGARIEGVALVGGVMKAVYQVDLGQVNLARLSDDSNLGFSAELEFDKIITRTLNGATGAVTGVSGWDLVTDTATTVPLNTVPAPSAVAGTVATGLSYFLKMDGVGGDATLASHLNWNEVEYSSELSGRDLMVPRQGVLNLSFLSPSAITQLMARLTQGAEMTAVLETVDRLGRVVSVMEMRGAYLAQVNANLEGNLGAVLTYEAFELTTNRFNAANAVVGFDRFGVDLAQERETTVTPTAVATAVLKVAPSRYYMAFDGLNCGVQTAQRGGWFVVNAVEFGAGVAVSALPGGDTVSEPQFSTVTLNVTSFAGLTGVLALLASGAATRGVAIEGITGSGGLERTVLDLSLGAVNVIDVQVNPEGGFRLTLAFGEMSLDTWGNVPVGANTGQLQTQWNLETGTNVLTGPILAAPGGTVGDDVLAGSAMADAMDGSAGNDAIHGLAGNDTLNGGAGGDTLEGGMGNDVLNGGGGTADYASYAGASGAVTVSLSVTTAQDTVNAGSDRLLNIEGLIGSVFADRLTGDNLTNVIRGGAGADTISGLAGNDLLQGEGGADVLVGGAGGDVLTGGAGNDRFIFNAPGEGVDTITDFESSATPGDTDVLQFARAAFGGLATGGILASQFQASLLPTASTADVRFLYASANFGLFYDADGSGGAFDPVMLAQIFAPVVAGDIQFI